MHSILLEGYQRFQPIGAERNVEFVFLLNMKCLVILKLKNASPKSTDEFTTSRTKRGIENIIYCKIVFVY